MADYDGHDVAFVLRVSCRRPPGGGPPPVIPPPAPAGQRRSKVRRRPKARVVKPKPSSAIAPHAGLLIEATPMSPRTRTSRGAHAVHTGASITRAQNGNAQ